MYLSDLGGPPIACRISSASSRVRREIMIATVLSNSVQSVQRGNLEGKRFYSPGVIAGYCIVMMTVGLVLYGLNLCRRGKTWNGRLLIILSIIITFQSMVSNFLPGENIYGRILSTLPILVAFGLYKKEMAPYERAISCGAIPAKWWPPLLWILIALFAICIILLFTQ
jgi:hypothetical protein